MSTDNAGTAGVPDVLLSYGYDAVNNRTSVTDAINGVQTGIETFSYDALDRLTRVTQSGSGVAQKRVDMTYDAASQMSGLQRYSDLAGTQTVADTAYVHDAAGRLTGLTHERNGTPIADYGFTYDAANRLTQLTTPDGTSDYSYNQRDELTSSNHSYQDDEGYTYDDTGNRTNAGYATGDHNRLLSDGTYSYEYDNEGNRTKRVDIASGEVTEYGWDTCNRMTSVTTKDSGGTVTKSVEYTYDLYDRRIAKSVDSDGDGTATATEERYVYDGEHIALVFDGEGNQVSRYLHGPQIDQILAEETAAGEVRWALADHQGSVRDVIDNQGNLLNHLTYDSYGQVTSETNPDLDFRFGYTGREWDEETGLYYYRARYFDPAPGTFVSVDPLGFAAGDPNVYRYVFNSPTNYTDPSGELPILAVLAIGAAVGAGLSYLDQRAQMADGIICEVNWWDVGRGAVLGAGVAGVGLAAAPILASGSQAALTLRAGLFASAGLGMYTSANDAVGHFRRGEYASGAFDTGLAGLSLFSAGAASPPSSGPQFSLAGGGSYAQASAAAARGIASSVGAGTAAKGVADDIGDADIFRPFFQAQHDNTSKNAAELRKNMEGKGIDFKPSEQAHHIVPSTHRKGDVARQILDRNGIDINAASNGVPLPHDLHHGKGLHSYKGINKVTQRLKDAEAKGGKADVTEELQRLSQEMKNGKFQP